MTTIENILMIDGVPVKFEPDQSILEAALQNGIFIPHLCWHPDFGAHASCKLCIVVVNGRNGSACTIKAMPGQEVFSNTPELEERRRTLLQMLFVEGNHFCPGCEKSGDCKLQAYAYEEEMLNPHFNQFYPNRPLDGSHPDILLDLNRCIMCELCVRASRDVDGKSVFGLAGRGRASHIVVNSPSGKLGDTNMSVDDRAAHVCPVGAILVKRVGFATPIGQRTFDKAPISELGLDRGVAAPVQETPE